MDKLSISLSEDTPLEISVDAVNITTGIEPQEISGSTLNGYVFGYITEALDTYPNDIGRTTTAVTKYSTAVSGVRKDEPVPLTVNLPAGELSVRDNSTDTTIKSTVTSRVNDIYNVSQNGGDYIVVKSNGEIVDVGTLNPTNALRMIYASSVFNVRDLGGWETYTNSGEKEGTIKYGKFYRGSEIYDNISSADKKMFAEFLGIRAEIDFYGSYTGENSSILGDRVIYTDCHTNKFYDTIVDLTDTDQKAIITRAINAAFYAAENNLPLYFHCKGGADRTGTLAFILGAMLGMNETELDIEWELTSFSAVTPTNPLAAGARTRNGSGTYSVGYRNMISYFKSCTTNPSSIRDAVVAWAVLAGIDIADINTFRANMIDGTPETISAHINYNATAITLNKQSVQISVGNTTTITATVTPSWATSNITWSSNNTSVATVSASGKVCTITGVATGNATITATCNGHTATCGVTAEAVPARLPSAYQEVEYIENTTTAWIDTEIISKYGIRTVVGASLTTSANYSGVIAAYGSVRDVVGFTGVKNWWAAPNAASAGTAVTLHLDTKYNIDCLRTSEGYLTYDSTHSAGTNTYSNFTNTVTYGLFARNKGTSVDYPFKGRVYYCEIYDNGTLVANMIPCYRKSDNVSGMYDIVRSKFYISENTDSFTAGNAV